MFNQKHQEKFMCLLSFTELSDRALRRIIATSPSHTSCHHLSCAIDTGKRTNTVVARKIYFA
jgi:hypothetical protein